jgi:transposase
VCLETRRAKAAMGAMPNKTDRNDARGLARIVRTGRYRAVHVKSPACRSWRALLAARRLVLNKMRDLENGLRALLREAGLEPGRPAREEFAARVRARWSGPTPCSPPRPSRCSRSSPPWRTSWPSSPGACSPSCATSRSAGG